VSSRDEHFTQPVAAQGDSTKIAGIRKTTLRTAIRIAAVLTVCWYIALFGFSLAFPQCSSGGFVGSDQVTCRIGGNDYGDIYRAVVMFSAFGLSPIGFSVLLLSLVLETGLHRKTQVRE
jgi:hypothetical protein